ncbi:MAG TPA: hypothetical protein VMP13_06255 [Acidimicrobiia bacterium]|nr:hypothetical protein [Acidimicrobiia bacterium]
MSAAEAMRAADPNYKTPHEEFGGREKPNFLDDMLAAGQRDLAERQARAKQRAAEKLREDLQ